MHSDYGISLDDLSSNGKPKHRRNSKSGSVNSKSKQIPLTLKWKTILERSFFGVLYAMMTNQGSYRYFGVLATFVDMFQLMAFAFLGDVFPWGKYISNGQGTTDSVATVLSYLQIPVDKFGYTFFLTFFIIVEVLIFFSITTGLVVAFNFSVARYKFILPIRMLRAFVFFLVTVLFLPILNVLLSACSNGPYLESASNTLWIIAPYLPAISLTSAVFFVTVSWFVELIYYDHDPLSVVFTARAHSRINFVFLVAKTFLIVLFRFGASPWVLAFALFICTLLFVALNILFVPYFNTVMNNIRTGQLSVVLWSSLCAIITLASVSVHMESVADGISLLFWIGLLPSFLAGFFAALYRQKSLQSRARTVLRGPALIEDANMLESRPIQFKFVTDVEITSRFIYEFVVKPPPESSNKNVQVPKEAVQVAIWVYRKGLAQFPRSAYLHMSFSVFLRVFANNPSLSLSEAERAQATNPYLDTRFLLFKDERDREHARQSESAFGTGEGTMDLLSYIEFHNHFHNACSHHRNALYYIRDFWKLILKKGSLISDLPEVANAVTSEEKKAKSSYEWLLRRYPNSSQVLRAYSSFLRDVLNNPKAADRVLDRVARIERFVEKRRQKELRERASAKQAPSSKTLPGTSSVDFSNPISAYTQIHSTHSAVITISYKGIIQNANSLACKMFGYKRDELVGNNIHILMGSPYKEQHDFYLKRYMESRVPHILGTSRSVEGRHKDGSVIAILLSTTKINLGDEIMFAGVLELLPEKCAKITFDPFGTILNINRQTTTLFNYSQKELVKSRISILFSNEFNEKFSSMAHILCQFDKQKEPGGLLGTVRNLECIRKNGSVFPAHVETVIIGNAEVKGKPYYSISIQNVEGETAIITTDEVGKMESFNRSLPLIFGFTDEEMKQQNVHFLMPKPYSTYHCSYMEQYIRTGQSKILGKWRRVYGQHKDQSIIPLLLNANPLIKDGIHKFAGKLIRISNVVGYDSELTVRISQYGNILSVDSSIKELFGYEESEVIGRNVQILMPSSIAAKHTGFLQRYLSDPEHPHLVGKGRRSVEARHKNGNLFPISLEIAKEIMPDGAINFVGKIGAVMSRDALVTMDKNGMILSINDMTTRVFGYTIEEFHALHLSRLLPEIFESYAASTNSLQSSANSNHSERSDKSEKSDKSDDFVELHPLGLKILQGRRIPTHGKHKDGTSFPVMFEMSKTHHHGQKAYIAKITRVTKEEIQNPRFSEDASVFNPGGSSASLLGSIEELNDVNVSEEKDTLDPGYVTSSSTEDEMDSDPENAVELDALHASFYQSKKAKKRKQKSFLGKKTGLDHINIGKSLQFYMACIVLLLLSAFILVTVVMSDHKIMLERVELSGHRAVLSIDVCINLRKLGDSLEHGSFNSSGFVRLLSDSVIEMDEIHCGLYLGTSDLSQLFPNSPNTPKFDFPSTKLSDGSTYGNSNQKKIYTSPNIQIFQLLGISPITISQTLYNFFDAGRSFSSSALNYIIAATSINPLDSLNLNSNFFFVLKNLPYNFFDIEDQSTGFYHDEAKHRIVVLCYILGSFSVVFLALMVWVALFVIRPALKSTHTKRIHILELFTKIPRSVVKELAMRKIDLRAITISSDSEDLSSSETTDKAAPTPKQHHSESEEIESSHIRHPNSVNNNDNQEIELELKRKKKGKEKERESKVAWGDDGMDLSHEENEHNDNDEKDNPENHHNNYHHLNHHTTNTNTNTNTNANNSSNSNINNNSNNSHKEDNNLSNNNNNNNNNNHYHHIGYEEEDVLTNRSMNSNKSRHRNGRPHSAHPPPEIKMNTHQKNQDWSIFSAYHTQYIKSLNVLAIIFLGCFAGIIAIVFGTVSYTSEIHYASYRLQLSNKLAFLTFELSSTIECSNTSLICNIQDISFLQQEIMETSNQLLSAHENLVYGNSHLDLPGSIHQDQKQISLLYGPCQSYVDKYFTSYGNPAVSSNAINCPSPSSPFFYELGKGLDSALRSFVSACKSIAVANDNDGMVNSVNYQIIQTAMGLSETPNITSSNDFYTGEGVLRQQLQMSLDLFGHYGENSVSKAIGLAFLLFALCLISSAIVYKKFVYPITHSLKEESHRTKSMLFQVPSNVLRQLDKSLPDWVGNIIS